jgi:hypothetical protein
VLAPLDAVALVKPVRDAMRANIPVVVIDSGLEAEVGKDFVSFVATDNYQGARRTTLGELMGAKGTYLCVTRKAPPPPTSANEVSDTSRSEFQKNSRQPKYAGPTTETGMQVASLSQPARFKVSTLSRIEHLPRAWNRMVSQVFSSASIAAKSSFKGWRKERFTV